MAVKSSRFLAIGSGEPNISAGWTIRVLDYKDMTSPVCIAHEFTEFSFTQELFGPGTGSISFDEDSPFWTAILNNNLSNRTLMNNEYVIEAWDGGIPRFAWLAETVTNTIVGEDGARAITMSGPGIAAVLTWAKIGRPGWPTKPPVITTPNLADPTKPIKQPRDASSSDALPALTWEFTPTWPSMRMWYTTFRAAQRRGALKFVTPLFDANKDSAKQPWVWVKTAENTTVTTDGAGVKHRYGYRPSDFDQNLLDWLGDCTGQDYSKWFGQRLEWIMYPGFKLDVRQTIGSDRSKTVRFFQANIISDERTRTREEIATRVIVYDVTGNENNRTDKAGVAQWNLREKWDGANKNVTNASLLSQIADRNIKQTSNEKDQWSIVIPYDDPGRVPYRNFYVGDYIGINDQNYGSTPTAVIAPTKHRVMAITVRLTSDQTVPDCELTLKSMIDSKLELLQKQITQLINNPAVTDINDVKQVDVPTSSNTSQVMVYNPVTGKWEAVDASTFGSGGGASNIWVQSSNPAAAGSTTASQVRPGDFWLETYD